MLSVCCAWTLAAGAWFGELDETGLLDALLLLATSTQSDSALTVLKPAEGMQHTALEESMSLLVLITVL